MLYCDSCELNNVSSSALFPTGSIKPDYYFLGDVVSREEVMNNQVFSIANQANQYLINTMFALGMNMDNSRLFKLVRCNSTSDERIAYNCRDNCSNFAKVDIYKTEPKLIVALGSEVCRNLLGDKFRNMSSSRGRFYDVMINGKKLKVMPTYSPNYVLNNPESVSRFTSDLTQATAYLRGDLVDIDSKRLEYAMSYEEFKKYYDSDLLESKMPAYDLETNAVDSRSKSAKMVGFSLAPNGTTGIYIVRKSLEYEMPPEDWDKITELAKQYLSTRTALVHNIQYEGPFTLNEWGLDIMGAFEDTLIKARMLRGGDLGSAGLKDQCIKNLGYPDWDSDLDKYKSSFVQLLKLLKPGKSNNKWEFDHIRTRGFCSLLDEVSRYSHEEMYKIDSRTGKEALTRSGKMNEAVVGIRDSVVKYYTDDADYSIIMELVGEELCNLIDVHYDGVFSYGFIPMKLIRTYGAMDAVGTHDLNEYLDTQMTKLSEDLKIDLHRGYHYTKRQFVAGEQLELNGLHWNDDVANEEEKWCEDQCYNNLLGIIDSHFLDNHLLKQCGWIFNDYIVANKLDYVMEVLGQFNLQKNGIKLVADGRRITFKKVLEELSSKLGYDFLEANRELALSLIRTEAHNRTHFMDLKMFFNPGSNTDYMKSFVNSILVTNDIKVANLLARMNVMIDEEGFDLNKYPAEDRRLFQVLIDCKSYNKYVDEFNAKLDDDANDDEILESLSEGEDESDLIDDYSDPESTEDGSTKQRKIKLTDRDTYDKFMEVLETIQVRSSAVQRLVGESLNYKLEALNEGAIIDLHKYYVINGIVLDDQSTWTDRFWFLINYRIYKKCYKMRSTYITGAKVGRGQVWLVDQESYAKGENITRRIRKYDGVINPGETTIMQGTFNVCGAETLRWRAGLHTIPSDSTIKNIYDSRFKGGTIFAPDFSQMEVRVMSGVSRCTPMIEAFKAGADIHMQNAMKIFRRPADQITAAERRHSKMASFMILYGGDYKSFGEQFLDGDIPLAKYIYDSFYEAYPEIKNWIDDRHEEMRSTGKVTTLMNTYINISEEKFNGDSGKALRAAQNYPIQSAGSYMAGNVLYEVILYMQNMMMLSKCELFIHDSIEMDIHPKEMLEMAVTILPLMNKYPMDEFGIPTTADLTVGVSIGQELECTDIETNEEFTEGWMTCSGMEEDFDLMISNWRKVYEVVEYEFLADHKPMYESWSQLFVAKRAINRHYGTTRMKIKARVHIKYGDKINEIYPDYDDIPRGVYNINQAKLLNN